MVTEPLPVLYAPWVSSILGGAIPKERKATCQNCAMLERNQKPTDLDSPRFSAITKCCTYMPEIPNFLVGLILRDETPDLALGRQTVVNRIATGVRVTPLSLGISGFFSASYSAIDSVFGRSSFLQCPHLLPNDGGCGIWPYRNNVCSTWFCKFNRGMDGEQFWREVKGLLHEVEGVLRLWCAGQLLDDTSFELALDVDAESPSERLTQELLDTTDYMPTHGLWGRWASDRHAYYLECARLVETLSWEDVASIGGVGLRKWERRVSTAYRRLMNPALPTRLHLGSGATKHNRDGTITLSGRWRHDGVVVTNGTYELLTCMGDSSIAGQVQVPSSETLDQGVLQELYDLRILTEPTDVMDLARSVVNSIPHDA